MPKCEITINIDGIVNSKPFNSEKELDGWLYDHQDSLSEYIDPETGLITFSLNLKEGTRQKLIEENKKWKALGERSIPKTDNPNSIEEASLGVTLSMNFAGNKISMDKPIDTYDEESQKTRFIERQETKYIQEGVKPEDAKIDAIKDWERQQKEYKTINELGTAAHNIVEDIFKNQFTNPNSKKYGILAGNTGDVKKVSDIAYKLQGVLRDRFKNISFDSDVFIETDIYSKEINSEYKHVIQGIKTAQSKINQMLNSGKAPDKKAALNLQNILAGGNFNLHGKIDMLVIDDNGAINLYDFKFSSTPFNEWHPVKLDKSEMQLQMYAAMLRQAGFKVGEVGIIPIYVKPDPKSSDGHIYELSGNTYSSIVKLCDDFATKTMADLIIPNNIKVDLSSLNKINKEIGELFPGKDLDRVSKKNALDIAYFRSEMCKAVTSNDPKYDPNIMQWYFYDNVSKLDSGGRAPKIYFTKENAEKVIGDYLKKYNENRANINIRIGRKFKDISKQSQGKRQSLLNFFRNFSANEDIVEGNLNLFYPFFLNGWNLVGDTNNDEALWANGIYMFEKDNVVQIIYMDATRNLGEVIKINNQTSIFGNTKLDSEIDKTQDLESTYANLLAMKVMCYISETPYFDTKRVLGVTVKNFEEAPIFQISNDLLIKNWNKLVFENSKISGLKTIDNRKMLDEISASLFMANQWISTINGGESLSTQIKSTAAYKDSIAKTIANVELILNQLKKKYFRSVPITEVKGDDVNSPAYKAVVALSKTLLSLTNIYMVNEADVGRTWEPETRSLGTNFSPHFMSESSNLRNLDKMSSAYFDDLATRFRKDALPWQKLMKDAIEEWQSHPELHYSSNVGGEFTVFNQWFRRDPMDESKIDKNLILRDPNDAYFRNLPASRKLLTYFLEKLNIMRYGSEEESSMAKANNEEVWYSVPLMRSGTVEQIGKFNDINDFVTALEAWWKRKTQTGLEGYDDAEIEEELMKQLNDLDSARLKNVYFQINSRKRQELLDKQDNIYETNLDVIFLRVLAENSKVKASETFLPMFTAYRTILYYNSIVNHQPTTQIMEVANDFIRRRVFRQNIIDSKLQGIAMVTGMLRAMVSSITLGINMRNFVRENLISFIDSAKETFLKSGYMVFPVPAGNINERRKYFKYYSESLANVASHTFDMNDVMSEVQQLNAMYRMVDYDQRKMAHTARTNRFAPLNLTEDFLYITSNLPDYYHRNAILIASLKYLGAWEAHQINQETGELEYDMTKDKRYKILFDYNFDRKKVPYDKFDEYLKAENDYRVVLNEWNSAGWSYKFGDKFELALSPREAANVRNFGHTMFGCYDTQQRAMINEYFLGSLFFQFKTYAMNQVIKYTRAGGAVNIIHPRYVIDEDSGEQLYDVTTTAKEYQSSGGKAIKRVKYSEVSKDDLISGRAKSVVEYTGAYMEGMFRTAIAIPGVIMHWNQEELEKYWNQPHVRANILGSLWDNLFMLMMFLLISQMYGTDTVTDMDEQSWLTQWTYGVLTGIAKNGLIWEVANSVYGDGLPPMVSSLKRYYTTIHNVIFGDTNLLYAITDTFGATRELSGLFKTED